MKKTRVVLLGPKMRFICCLVVALCLLIIASWGERQIPGNAPSKSENITGSFIVLFFDGSEGDNYALGREIRCFPEEQRDGDRIRFLEGIVEELICGPAPGSLLAPTIPPGTELLELGVDEGIVTVVFSRELARGHWGGSRREEITVFSITNTLTRLPEVKGVQIEIKGHEEGTLAGHVPLDQIFSFNPDLL